MHLVLMLECWLLVFQAAIISNWLKLSQSDALHRAQGVRTSLLPLPKPLTTGPCNLMGNGVCGPLSGPA